MRNVLLSEFVAPSCLTRQTVFLAFLFFLTKMTVRNSSHLVYEVSVNTIRQLLDEGIHD